MIKTLLIDIETAPNLSYVWGHYDQSVIKHVKPWYILCVGMKWLNEPTEVITLPEMSWSEDAMIGVVWDYLDDADIVVGHNGDKFDLRKLNAKFIEYGMTPPSPYKTVDTLKVARRVAKFNQNGLGPLSAHLDIGNKISHEGFSLWERCMVQDPEDEVAWRKMVRYAKRDVDQLEKLYKRLLPWIPNFPSVAEGGKSCPHCQSKRLQRRGFYRTKTMTYQRYWCKDCGAWSRSRLSEPQQRPEVV